MSFSKEEYKQRLKKVQKMMQEKGIELLISHDTNNMNYLTGYDAWSFYYAQCAIVHIDADEPLCFVRAQDAGGAYITTYLKNESVIVYDENYIHKWPKHPYDYLVEIIKERKWDKLNIGVEMDAHYFTAFCYEKIKQGLPNAQIKDSDRLVNWARLVKSDAEIGFMKSAAKISEKGMKTAMEVIKPGVRQCDAVGEIQKTLFNEIKGRIKLEDESLPYKDRDYEYWTKTTTKGNYSIKLRKKVGNESVLERTKTEQTHRYITSDHEMNLVFSENTGEYLNKTSANVIPSSKKEKITELTENTEKTDIINTLED